MSPKNRSELQFTKVNTISIKQTEKRKIINSSSNSEKNYQKI